MNDYFSFWEFIVGRLNWCLHVGEVFKFVKEGMANATDAILEACLYI